MTDSTGSEPPQTPWSSPAPAPPPPPPPPPPPAHPPYPPPVWQQQQAWPQQPWQPPPKRKSRLKLWLTIGGTLFAIVAGCATWVGVTFYNDQHAANHTVNAYLDAANRGDAASARSYVCDEYQNEPVPQVASHKIVGDVVSHSTGRPPQVEVTVDVRFPDGTAHRDVVLVQKLSGHWLICGVQRAGGG